MAHRVVNVYGDRRVEIVENAIEWAKMEGADSDGEALALIAAAFTGHGDDIFDTLDVDLGDDFDPTSPR